MLTFQEINLEGGITSEVQSMGFPLVLKYLRDRGVPESLIDDLGIKILPASELIQRARQSQRIVADDRLAAVFPHFNAKGDYIDWWSARLVDTNLRPVIHSFANLVPHKRGKMFCPPNEPPHAYLVPTLDWRKLSKGAKVYLHESCTKAIAGAQLGYWSVGLNGVWGWGSRKHGLALVQELKDLPWKALQLQPVIVFDSNAEDNWDVQNAIGRLAARILEITGQHATHILLPRSPDGTHWGFDDYVAVHGAERATEFLESEGTPVAVDELQLLKLQLNDEVCVVRSLGRIADQNTGTLMSRQVFTDVNYAHFTARVEDGDDERVVNVPKIWLADPKRVVVDELTFMPGRPKIHDDKLNLWHGMGLEPAEGDVRKWLDMFEANVPDEGLRKWMIQWMAYPLQNLGYKLTTYIHLFGPPGSGKQALVYPLMRIYGKNAVVIAKEQIQSSFNSIYANRQFVNLDEIHGGADASGVMVANKLKRLVTGDTLTVNMKGQPEYEVPNCANIVSTANYSDAIRLDDDDRRAAVIRFGKRGTKYDKTYWTSYFGWVDDVGAAAVYHYLLGVDLTGFDPKGWAPMTEEKEEVTRATRRVDEQWVNDLWEDPDVVLPPIVGRRALFTGKELAQYCFGDDPMGVTPAKTNSLGIKLHSAGFSKIELKVDGRKMRYWVVRGRDETWTSAGAQKHLALFKLKV